MRLFFALLVSICICIGIFFGMHLMTSSNTADLKKSSKTKHLVYLREKKDTNIERKKELNQRSH